MSVPQFNRLALAAALLEYDNDPEDRYGDNVDHRRSAIFRGVYDRPPQLPSLRDGRRSMSSPQAQAGGPAPGAGAASAGHDSLSNSGAGSASPSSVPGAGPSPPPQGRPGHGYQKRQSLFPEPAPAAYAPHAHLRPPGARDAPSLLQMSGPYPIVGAAPVPVPPQHPQQTRRTMSGDWNQRNSRWISEPDAGGSALPQLQMPEDERRQLPPGVDLSTLPDVRRSVAVAHLRDPSLTRLSERGVVSSRSSNTISIDRQDGTSPSPQPGGELGGERPQSTEAKQESVAFPLPSPSPAAGARRASVSGLVESARPEPVMVPLPSSPITSPITRPMSAMNLGRSKSPSPPVGASSSAQRRTSTISAVAPHLDINFDEDELLRNPFELAPSTEFASRFDPKTATVAPPRRSLDLDKARSESRVSGSVDPRASYLSERRRSLTDSFYAEPVADYESQHLPQQRVFDEIPHAGEYGRPLQPPKYGSQAYRIKRYELLRPKTLIMPSLLEGTEKPTASVHIPAGFTLGEKPLPADARASILNMGMGVPLSLAQRTFRSSLMVGGRREDEEYFRGHAAEEGEVYEAPHLEDEPPVERLPGKLYGTSLIDQLEARKLQTRNKKRVFYGDNRPSMMARIEPPAAAPEQQQHEGGGGGGGALSPPKATLGARPSTTFGPPTITVPGDEEEDARRERIAKSRSVFGVDTVWERELQKLKAIQEAEKRATDAGEMERLALERERIEKADRRRTRFLRSRSMVMDNSTPHLDLPNPNRMDIGIPDLAAAPGERRITMFGDNRQTMFELRSPADSETPGGGDERRPRTMIEGQPGSAGLGVENWFESSSEDSDSDDEDDNIPLSTLNPSVRGSAAGSVRALSPQVSRGTTAKRGPMSPSAIRMPPPPQLPVLATSEDESSEEDVPLSRVKAQVYDSDEEVPLSRLRKSPSQTLPTTSGADSGATGTGSGTIRLVGSSSNDEGKGGSGSKASQAMPDTSFGVDVENSLAKVTAPKEEDEDDLPLYLRREKAKADRKKEQTVDEIEDDLPLAWKHAGAAQKQAGRGQQAQSMMSMNPYGSQYMSTYGMPMGGMSPYGMPMGMGGMGMGGMGGMMMPPGPGAMGYPSGGGGGPGGVPLEMPDPGSNIDNWRKQIGTAASGQSTAGGAHPVSSA